MSEWLELPCKRSSVVDVGDAAAGPAAVDAYATSSAYGVGITRRVLLGSGVGEWVRRSGGLYVAVPSACAVDMLSRDLSEPGRRGASTQIEKITLSCV